MNPPRGPVAVTGVAGFIGFCVADRLLREGVAVVGVDDLSETYYAARLKRLRLERLEGRDGFAFHRLDLADAAAVADLFARTRPSHVLHLAAQAAVLPSFADPQLYLRSNVLGTQAVLDAARGLDGLEHLVYASTSSVYGRSQDDTPFQEDQPTATPVSVYGASKVANEAMAQAQSDRYGMPVTGLRFFKVYGPWGRPDTVFFKFVDRIWRGEPVRLHNHGKIYHAFTFIDDVVDGVVRALSRAPEPQAGVRHPIYNLGNDRSEHLGECVDAMEAAIGRAAIRDYVPLPPGDRSHSRANVDRARRDLGYDPKVRVAEGIPKLVEWYRDVCAPLGEPLDRL